MERPALKRLLADIQEKLVDVVVVYKVDRLTRSLSDFAKMVDISQIARTITGTQWSGPLFFGLKSRTEQGRGAA